MRYRVSLIGAAAIGVALGLPPRGAEADSFYHVLHSFDAPAGGQYPSGVVVHRAGPGKYNWALYGTATQGGLNNTAFCMNYGGCGTVFELVPPRPYYPRWSYSVIYSFKGEADGATPQGPLTFDSTGSAYGTTEQGGAGCGSVFKLSPPASGQGTWAKQTLTVFSCDGCEGVYPWARLVIDRSGAVYGTSSSNGKTNGTVFKLSPPAAGSASWTRTILYSLTQSDGVDAFGGVIFGPGGNLYGSTSSGIAGINRGTIFRLSPPTRGGTAWSHTTLYTFPDTPDGLSGSRSELLCDPDGTLYGSSFSGGATNAGGVFRLTPPGPGGTHWTFSVLHEFSGPDGRQPGALAHLDGTTALFGVTETGSSGQDFFDGVVFKLIPPKFRGSAWNETVLHRFSTGQNTVLGVPTGALVRTPDDEIVGSKHSGGGSFNGQVFSVPDLP